MSDIEVRGYRGEDETDLIELWNAALPYDPVGAPTLRRRVILDPNFRPDGLLVVEGGEGLLGFCLCLVRRVPLEKVGLQPDLGWITAMGVRPRARRRGVGSALLDGALEFFRSAGCRQVHLASYVPNYFVPGVDVEHYPDGLAFLCRRGFQVTSRPLSMDASIVLFEEAEWAEREEALRRQGVEVRTLQPWEIPALMEFLQSSMPGDWVRHAREALLDVARRGAATDEFIVALSQGEIVGYCQFEGEHFGPFGVREDQQGRGIGTVLMVKCLAAMRRRGLHNAWVLWTSDEAADRVYARFGFRETRRFAVLRREL